MRMKTAGIFLGITCTAVLLTGCGGKQSATKVAEESEATEKEGTGEDAQTEAAIKEAEEAADESEEQAENEPLALVGIALPDRSTKEGRMDGELLSEGLAGKNLEVKLFYAERDAEKQEEQIHELIKQEPALLIIDPVDPFALTEVLKEAAEEGIKVFSYEDLIMDSGDIAYYVTFDKRRIGQQIGETIVNKKDLKKLQESGGSASIEFFMGADDNMGALFLYNGVMEVLAPYLEDGTLYCPSGQISFEETAAADFDAELAGDRYQAIVKEFYPGQRQPEIVCTGFDGACCSILEILENESVFPESGEFPLLTGAGCEADAVRGIAESKVSFDIYMDRKTLADTCISMVTTICADGEKPEVNNYEQYDNGVKLIRTNTCLAELVDIDNYEMLIDRGVFTANEVEPRVTPTPAPTSAPSTGAKRTSAPERTPTPKLME